ncbi:MAG: M56 family metallopeptidase [Pirellulales bacterium]
MISSQLFVVGWIEYSLAAFILLAAMRILVTRFRNPIDRVHWILIGFLIISSIPLGLVAIQLPGPSLGLFQVDSNPHSNLNKNRSSSAGLPALVQSLPVQQFMNHPAGTETVEPSFNESKINENSNFDAASLKTNKANPILGATRSYSPRYFWDTAAFGLIVCYGIAFIYVGLQWLIAKRMLSAMAERSAAPSDRLLNIWRTVSQEKGNNVRILVSSDISSPIVFSLRGPTILMPSTPCDGNTESIRYCLAHEWAHIQGGDLLRWNVIQIVQLLMWYQPVYWALRRELQINLDILADSQAATFSGDIAERIQYSEFLLSIAKNSQMRRQPSAIAFASQSSQLARRIRTLLNTKDRMQTYSHKTFLVLTGILFLASSTIAGSIRLGATFASHPTAIHALNTVLGATNSQGENWKYIRGSVTNEEGQPVAGTRLLLPLQMKPRRTLEAIADEHGNFEFRYLAEWTAPSISTGFSTIWAYAPGFCIQTINARETLYGNLDREYNLQLPLQNNAEFKVLTLNGRPLRGVSIQPHQYKTTRQLELIPEEIVSRLSGETDEAGKVILRSLQANLLHSIESHCDKYGRQRHTFSPAISQVVREIRLHATGSIVGRLACDNMDWIEGVRVFCRTVNRNVVTGIAEAITDHEGRFQMPIIAAGDSIDIHVEIAPELPVRPRLPEKQSLAQGETRHFEIPLLATANLRGQVIEQSTHTPIPNVQLFLQYGDFFQGEKVITDTNGKFEGLVLPGKIRAEIIGLPEGFRHVSHGKPNDIFVSADAKLVEANPIEIIRTETVSGLLVDVNHRPMANSKLITRTKDQAEFTIQTNGESNFRVHLSEALKPRFDASTEHGTIVQAEVIRTDPLVIRVPLIAPTGNAMAQEIHSDVVLTGRVLCTDVPTPDVQLFVYRYVTSTQNNWLESSPKLVGSVKTDATGEYRITGLRTGESFFIEVVPPFAAIDPKWRWQFPWGNALPENTGKDVTLPDVELLRCNQKVGGIVVDSYGTPVEGILVEASLQDGSPMTLLNSTPVSGQELVHSKPSIRLRSATDRQGRFAIEGLPDAPIRLKAYNPLRLHRFIKIDDIATTVDALRNQRDLRIVIDLPNDDSKRKQ